MVEAGRQDGTVQATAEGPLWKGEMKLSKIRAEELGGTSENMPTDSDRPPPPSVYNRKNVFSLFHLKTTLRVCARCQASCCAPRARSFKAARPGRQDLDSRLSEASPLLSHPAQVLAASLQNAALSLPLRLNTELGSKSRDRGDSCAWRGSVPSRCPPQPHSHSAPGLGTLGVSVCLRGGSPVHPT